MFRSIRYVGHGRFNTQSEYEITDSDFVVIVNGPRSVAVAREYDKRNLPVAKNIVLLCLYLESRGTNIEKVIRLQDDVCSGHIANWDRIAEERNRYLDKLSAMK